MPTEPQFIRPVRVSDSDIEQPLCRESPRVLGHKRQESAWECAAEYALHDCATRGYREGYSTVGEALPGKSFTHTLPPIPGEGVSRDTDPRIFVILP